MLLVRVFVYSDTQLGCFFVIAVFLVLVYLDVLVVLLGFCSVFFGLLPC